MMSTKLLLFEQKRFPKTNKLHCIEIGTTMPPPQKLSLPVTPVQRCFVFSFRDSEL